MNIGGIMAKKKTRTISPRLKNDDSRIAIYHGLPEAVKEGLRSIANKERKSIAWVLEECIIDYFGLRKPSYKGKGTVLSFNRSKAG